MRELVSLCSKVAFIVLYKRVNDGSQFLINNVSNLKDVAIDAIVPLFIANKCGELPLRNVLLNWDKEINDEASAYYFLHKIICNRIEQEQAKRLKEADPFFGKILRSINHLVESNRINKASWFGILYLIEKDYSRLTQKPIEPEFIENLPSNLFVGTNEKIVNNIFHHIKTETDFFPSIPLNALIRKIKYVNGSFLQQSNQDSMEENFEERINVDQIVSESSDAVRKRIDDVYHSKGKLDKQETDIFKKVLVDLANDLKDGGISRGLYEYVNAHMAELSKETFYKKYHHTLDYLLRLLKKEIVDRLEISNN